MPQVLEQAACGEALGRHFKSVRRSLWWLFAHWPIDRRTQNLGVRCEDDQVHFPSSFEHNHKGRQYPHLDGIRARANTCFVWESAVHLAPDSPDSVRSSQDTKQNRENL